MKIPKYQDSREKEENFDIIWIDSFQDLLTEFKKTDTSDNSYIFRGIHGSEYKLFSSLHRLKIERNKNKNSDFEEKVLVQQIKTIIKNPFFKKLYKRILEGDEKPFDLAQHEGYLIDQTLINFFQFIISNLQHYEGYTPFVDFTKNIDVALFFAFRNLNKTSFNNILSTYSSIYVLNSKFISKYRHICFEDEVVSDFDTIFECFFKNNTTFSEKVKDLFLPRESLLFLDYSKYLFNLNILAQEGCFLNYYISNDLKPLEDYYYNGMTINENLSRREERLQCIEINHKLVSQVNDYLKEKGVMEESMFPDLSKMVTNIKFKI